MDSGGEVLTAEGEYKVFKMDNGARVSGVDALLEVNDGGGASGVDRATAKVDSRDKASGAGKSFKVDNGNGGNKVLMMANGGGAFGAGETLKVGNGNVALDLYKALKMDKRGEALCASEVEDGAKALRANDVLKKTNEGGKASGRDEVVKMNKVDKVSRKAKRVAKMGKSPNTATVGTALRRDDTNAPDGAWGLDEVDTVCDLDALDTVCDLDALDTVCDLDALDTVCEVDDLGPLEQILSAGVLAKVRCGRSFAMARSGRALVSLDHADRFGYANVSDAIVDVLVLPPPGTAATDAAPEPEEEESPAEATPPAPPPAVALVAVVFESGRVDFWRSDVRRQRHEMSPAGRADLCISPRARVLSAAAFSSCLLWCESRSSSAPRSSRDLLLRHCVCRRAVSQATGGGGPATLGGVQVLLHGCPTLHVVPSADVVHLVPFQRNPTPLQSLLPLWSPRDGTVSAVALRRGGVVCARRPDSDADFKGLALGCASPPPTGEPIVAHTACRGGGLLLGLSDGRLWRVERDGACRVLCRCDLLRRGSRLDMLAVKNALAVASDRDVEMFDTRSGHLIRKIKGGVCILSIMSDRDEDEFRFLTEKGIYRVDTEPARSHGSGSLRPQDVLSAWVYEEACSYYQKRSLTGNKITPEQLKQGGAGKGAASVVAILSHAVCPKNTNSQAAPFSVNLENALKPLIESYVKIEQIKRTFVVDDEAEIQYAEFIKEEVSRLLQGRDMGTPQRFQSLLDTFLSETLSAVWDILGPNNDGAAAAGAAGGGTNESWRCVMQENTDRDCVPPVYEQLCVALYQHRPEDLLPFVGAAQESQRAVPRSRLSADSAATPPHLRALFVLPESKGGGGGGEEAAFIRTELLCRGSPEDAAQAIQLLLSMGMWQQAVAAASRYRIDNQMLQAQVFTTFLDAFTCSRGLDPYVGKVWELCPDSMTATDVLATVLHNLPNSHDEAQPFGRRDAQITIELLRPLLTRLLLKESARFEM
ncbi:BLOC-2 complex member HPS6 [Petromyzon marinus]|uniref:BLOC-2 complex member HPS6 n=1 Tax=Petromyzon marinus TaxID=7757 RepID=UPI003F6F6065